MNLIRVKSLICCVTMMCFGAVLLYAQNKPEVSQSEYQVYDAVLQLMQFPIPKPYIVIADTTLNSGCGSGSGNPVLMNGCGMFKLPPVDQTHTLLIKSCPQMEPSAWDDLVLQSKSSYFVQDSFKSSWMHKVADLAAMDSTTAKRKDGIVLFSSVGFSTDHKQALVYVLFLSYMKQVPTSENYFLFQLTQANKWKPIGRLRAMESE